MSSLFRRRAMATANETVGTGAGGKGGMGCWAGSRVRMKSLGPRVGGVLWLQDEKRASRDKRTEYKRACMGALSRTHGHERPEQPIGAGCCQWVRCGAAAYRGALSYGGHPGNETAPWLLCRKH